eukprot:1430674-Rhodomonas_salina.1
MARVGARGSEGGVPVWALRVGEGAAGGAHGDARRVRRKVPAQPRPLDASSSLGASRKSRCEAHNLSVLAPHDSVT